MCTEQLSRLPRHLLCYLCNDPLSCSQGLQDTFLCSTSNALLLSTELISRLSRSLFSSACIALCVGTELLSRLPRHHPCSISNALLVSTELLSRFEDTFSTQSASLFLYVLSSSQGPRFLLCYLCNDPLSCSQGLQETFSALCIVSLQASIPTMICPSSHFKEGLSKTFFIVQSSFIRASQGKASEVLLFTVQSSRRGGDTARRHHNLAREGFSKCSYSSVNQPDAVPETIRYALPIS